MSLRLTLSILTGLLLLTACGHVEEMRSARQQQATEFNQRAQRAFQRGEYQVAAAFYENALQLDVAVENVDGIAVNALNLAKVNQVLGKTELARRYLDALLEDKALHYQPGHLAVAAVQKSLLLLRGNDVAGAVNWADKAVTYCTPDCGLSGVIGNARASIALRANDADKALEWGERASAINKNVPLEYANSLRLMATARLMKNEQETALRLSEEALVIDKTLGLPEKIQQDLLLLAQAHEKSGHAEQAAQYRDRAARIAATELK
jgi:tetratricopeptide (TPR) repeat protein